MAGKHSQIPSHSRGNDILETSRNAALESAANLLETLSHARDLKRRARAALEDRTEFDANDEEATPRDFLFDMLRLNASYLNELAKLGSHHKDLVRRALDNLYSSAAGPTSALAKDRVLSFNRKKWTATFVVQNDVNPEARFVQLEWENVLTAHSPSAENPFAFAVRREDGVEPITVPKREGGDQKASYSCPLDVTFGVPAVVEMTVSDTGFLKRRYHTSLTLTLQLGDKHRQVRRIPVELDMRDKLKPEAGSAR